MDVLTTMRERTSVRAYRSEIPNSVLIAKILDAARYAPSGTNTQPWNVHVLAGAPKHALSEKLLQVSREGTVPNPDYAYYPEQWIEPYKSRRFACGMALYSALNIERGDTARRREVWEANYHFFNAPIGLLFFIDRHLAIGSWMDMGMFLQNIMLAAEAEGLATCPQASLADYPDVVRSSLNLPHEKLLLCGMSLGFPDRDHPINQYRVDRESVETFTTWHGFSEIK